MNEFCDELLTLACLELLTVDVPQIEPFRSAIGKRTSRKALLVIWHDREGAWGIGECSCRPDPYFSHEYLDAVEHVISDFLFPHLEAEGSGQVLLTTLAQIRGWGFARAAVLEAVIDLKRRKGQADPLSGWCLEPLSQVPVGISLSLYDNAEMAIEKIAAAATLGYRRIKLKIKPGLEPGYLRTIRKAFPDLHLGCDANGSFSEHNMDELITMSELNLAMIEQPFAPDRLDLNVALKHRVPDLGICLDESIAELGDLIAAHRLGALDELNIKLGRVGGLPVAMLLADYCRQHEIPVWVGGMFETGIGRAANLRFAASFPDAQAHDLSPSTRYFRHDLVEDPIKMDAQGTVPRPQQPVSLDEERIASFLTKRIERTKK